MFNLMDYQHKRALQICIVFTITLLLQKWFDYIHAGWIGFFVMVIYAGFEAGASIQRTVFRFIGTIYGLVLSYLIWFVTQWHGSFLILIISIIFFCAFYFAGKEYTIPTIFTVTLTALGTEYYAKATYPVINFFFDYFRSAAIALFICVFFEYIVFSKSRLSERFYQETQKDLLNILHKLANITQTRPLKYKNFLTLTLQFEAKALELQKFMKNINFDLTAHYKTHLNPNDPKNLFDYNGLTYHPLTATQAFNDHIALLSFNLHQMAFISEDKLEKLTKETMQIITHIEGLHQTLVYNSQNKK